ncbi:hypothetical protein [Nonomuraea sp. NPDC050202]|jgi:hypothetical protein|uniref:hypothetical protein n=1 Tax=unclassified Nonomuraea TaxID=2593643 RepID=UPI00340DEF3B
MSETSRRRSVQWQDDTEHLKNRRDAVHRIASEAPRPSEPETPQQGHASDPNEGS